MGSRKTPSEPIGAKRSYRQFCALARALDLVGERWTLLMVRELLLGPRRYRDLLEALPGIGTNLLADRLKSLQAAGLVERDRLPPPAGSWVYRLTERGRALQPAIVELARFGLPLLDRRLPEEHYMASWSPLALRASFRPEEAAGVDESYELRVGDEVFHATVREGAMEAASGPADSPAFVLETDLDTFERLVTGRLDRRRRNRLRVHGDRRAFGRCERIFGIRRSGGST